ncbi:unnamed protein product [Gadus morhua 'NCC']
MCPPTVPILEDTQVELKQSPLRASGNGTAAASTQTQSWSSSDEDQVRHLNHARAPPRHHVPLEESSYYSSIDL